jgi:NADPH:quinone reductase-like Zn-dependent oxidoreductase
MSDNARGARGLRPRVGAGCSAGAPQVVSVRLCTTLGRDGLTARLLVVRLGTVACDGQRAALLFVDLKEHTRRVSFRLLVPEWGPRWLLARLPQLVELEAEHPELSLETLSNSQSCVPYRAPAVRPVPTTSHRGAAILKRLTPDAPRRAPIRWHVATGRDARAESPTARTLVLDVPEWPGHRAGHHVDVRLTVQVRTQQGGCRMKAIVVTDQAAGTAGMTLVERPEPEAAGNDVVVQVHASGFTPGELSWPSTWTDRLDRDRTPSIPGHELAGVVTALGYGTRGLSLGQRVFGLTDWTRDGTLAEYAAVEARNLAPLPGDVDFTVGASLPISGLTAWQGLFEHGRLQTGQSVLVHGAAGAVGSMVTQLAREAAAHVIGTGRAADRQKALDFGAQDFVDLDNDTLEDVGEVDLVFDVIGGDIGKRSAGLIRAGGTLVSIVGPTEARPADGLAVDFVVESDRAQLSEIVQRVRDGRLRTNIGNVSTLDDAVAAFNQTKRIKGKTIIRVRP